MMLKSLALAVALLAAPVVMTPQSFAQGPNNEARMSAQREAMKALAMLDGEWRGPAKSLRYDGNWHPMLQAERVGTMLDGTVRVLEGRGYEESGELSFGAFAVISYNPDTQAYAMRSYSGGRVGDFPIVPTATGFTWEIQAGPDMKIAYEAIVKDGVWTETGTRIPKSGEPVKFIEFSVTRLRDTAWPAAGAVQPKD
ncbi:MAG TPA: hypothetical protein PLH23_19585 [Hyphomonadaceae bacterium]|nr:hypothetical protein [Hyphomonadaceae bacterium]